MQYNANNPSIKRIMREMKEMRDDPSDQYTASPLEDNIFEWHFTVRGPRDSEFDGGLYHGRIILPVEYPFKPPNIVLLTPNGRFEVGTKICLSLTSYHPEQWQPSWSIKTILLALISFMPSKGDGAIGALDYPPQERRTLAKKSINYHCEKCGVVLSEILPPIPPDSPSITPLPSQPESIFSATTNTTTISRDEKREDTIVPSNSHNHNHAHHDHSAPLPPSVSVPDFAPGSNTTTTTENSAIVTPVVGVHGSSSLPVDYIIVALALVILALVLKKLLV